MRSVRGCKRTPISVEQAREWWDAVQGGQTTWKEIARANRMSIMWAFERSRGVLGIKVRGYTSRISEDAARKEYELCVSGDKAAKESAAHLGISWMTLNSVWCRFGFGRLPHRGGGGASKMKLISTATLAKYHDAILTGQSTIKHLARSVGIDTKTMQRYWRKAGMTNPWLERREREQEALNGGTK